MTMHGTTDHGSRPPRQRSKRRAYARPSIAVSRAHTAIAGGASGATEVAKGQGLPDKMMA